MRANPTIIEITHSNKAITKVSLYKSSDISLILDANKDNKTEAEMWKVRALGAVHALRFSSEILCI